MTKNNKLLIGIFVFVVSIMVGYALFSETITITGTATGKGDFNIINSCSKGIDPAIINMFGYDYIKEGGYRNDTCIVNDNSFSINVDLDYPTAGRWFTITMTNNGSIPAMLYLNDIEESFEVCVTGNGKTECNSINRGDYSEDAYNLVRTAYFIAMPLAKDLNNNYYFYSQDEASPLYDKQKGAYKIEKGESIVIPIYHYWQMDNPPYKEGTNYGDYKVTLNAKFNLVQFTN